MPYKRNYRKRRPYTRKAKGAKDKQVTVWSDHSVLEKANRALALVNNVRRFINVEVKHHTLEQTPTTITNAGSVIGLSVIAQGSTVNQREGNSIKPLNLMLRCRLKSNSADPIPARVRIVILRTKDENQVPPVIADYFATVGSVRCTFQFKAHENRFQNKALYDQRHVVEYGPDNTYHQ